ncbi:MAG: hypothetical protein U1D30_17585 [Planctomycetota bacterium]
MTNGKAESTNSVKKLASKSTIWGKPPVQLDSANRRWLGITEVDLAAWREAYPAVDIGTEIKRAIEWCIANGAKGRKSNYAKFITNWLGRQQDAGGSRGYQANGQHANAADDEAERQRLRHETLKRREAYLNGN